MKTLGNIIWFVFVGLWSGLAWLGLGLLWCITIIGIPFGLQAIKIASLAVFPFGKTVNSNFGKHPIANILWILLGGLGVAVGYLIAAVILCITIIGIPFGKQCFKMMTLAIAPFGATAD
jgi:uncharacterized membrane protein YccF (DUF307 family)